MKVDGAREAEAVRTVEDVGGFSSHGLQQRADVLLAHSDNILSVLERLLAYGHKVDEPRELDGKIYMLGCTLDLVGDRLETALGLMFQLETMIDDSPASQNVSRHQS